ncbi:MAG: TonB-dependent receptor, partial [Halobacteriales archaeon]|nr:TonB-dependent receptor [Halobacteriales archaeon]
MNGFRSWRFVLTAFAVLALVGAGTAFGQAQKGNLYGTVTDQQGSELPGVTVELTGIGAPRVQVTNAEGEFRFLGLDPGNYEITASLEGFSTVEYPNVNIRVNRNTTIEIQLSAAVEEVITVTSESPLLDERKVAKGTTVSQIELEKIPTARDPWAIVTQTPGVLSDRVNVGGNESGQQAVFIAPGTTDDENSFAVDGVLITDMAAIGASPTYYDFDQFEEMQISTGGSDIEKVSAGASLNLVTKRGSNTPRGSARYLLTESDEQFGIFEQANADVSGELEDGDGNGGLVAQDPDETQGNLINEVVDFGFEAGGPIVRDRLWVWGSYGRNDIKQLTRTGDPDNTLLENSAIKFNGQPVASNSIVGSWNRGDKIKDGRLANSFTQGASSWDQAGPSEIWKVEDTQVFSSDFYLTGLYSYVDGGFQLITKGVGSYPAPTTTDASMAVDQGESIWGNDFIFANGFYSGISDRNTDNYQVDGSYFFNTGDLSHELKFGVSYRFFESASDFAWDGGRNLINVVWAGEVWASRSGLAPIEQEYTALWLQDTLTWGSLTANVGLRYDLQEGQNNPSVVQANPVFSDLLPTLNFGGNDAGGFEWETISPRLGVTYALGAERKTLLRASYARFAEQLSSANITRVNPLATATAYFDWDDTNGNSVFDVGEPAVLIDWSGFDPTDPDALDSPNVTDPNLDPSLTDELLFGVEHAFLPEFVVGADVTYRLTSDVLETRLLVRDQAGNIRTANAGDYIFDHTVTSDGVTVPHLPNGQQWSEDYDALDPSLTRTGATLLTNGDREIEYLGLGVNFTKRLANRWMARG